MEINIVFQIAAVGILVAVLNQVLCEQVEKNKL